MRIDDLKADPDNPRTIDEDALKALGRSLEEFGDLSGITGNKRTGELVTGHQRVRVMKEKHGDDLDVINGCLAKKDGTEAFTIRTVDWDREKQRIANMVANSPKIGGQFTESATGILEQIENDFPDLSADLLLDELAEMLQEPEAPDFEPVGIEEQPRLDEKKPIKCPECGHEFTT